MSAMHETSAHDELWRAALSALFDGEPPTVPMGELMQHLSECASCSAWLDEAARVNADIRGLSELEPALGERVVNQVDVTLCACRTGGLCQCADCQCGPHCTCHDPSLQTVG